jgi:2-amino-4-hydroxy-6-hydroxymethyldihydropteridine diphosphokinase
VRASVLAYVGVGANLGNAVRTVEYAIAQVHALPRCELAARSSLYRTAPVDAQGPDYINAVIAVETRMPATELLSGLRGIELAAGRERPYRNAPRTLDLDLLLYGQAIIDSEQLSVPHPRMWERAFVLVPLAEIAPQLVGPEQLKAVAGQRIEKVAPLPAA